MTFAGSTQYDLDVLEDHRWIIVDINMKTLLGTNNVEEEIRTRKLVMSDQKSVQ